MFAFDQPPAVQAAPTEEQFDVIEVVGTRADQALKIDRRTYRVQQTPHTAQKDAVQLLRGLPAVTVTADDQILLLGSGNPKIFIDGRPYAGDWRQYLRTLHGSDIERIEIITNPSAQYSAEGTGGIINLVLRKKTDEDVSGNASMEASSYRRMHLDSTVKGKHGKWAYELTGGGNIGWMSRSTYHKRRSVEPTLGGPLTVNVEEGGGGYKGTDGRLSGKVSYNLDSRTTISAKLGGGGGHDKFVNDAEFRGLTPDFTSFSERRRLDSVASFLTADFNLDLKGRRDGETLSAAAQFYGNPKVRDLTDAQFSDATSFSTVQRKRSFVGHAQLDWNRPMGKGQILSMGGSWDLDDTSFQYRFTSVGGDGSLGPNATDEYDARSRTVAAYATFQQPLGKLTVVAGIRAEQNSRHIRSPGLPDVDTERTNLFPTVHLKYPFGKGLDLTASYSRRIDRVPLQHLRPYRTVEDAVTIFQGNPDLKDESTDAYEINLHYRAGKIDAGAILYVRNTSDLWSKSYSVTPDGTSVYTYVNAGRRRDSGAQFDLSAPILRRVKANVSVNLFDQQGPVDTFGGRQTFRTFRYTTNGTLQWNAPDRGRVPGDVAQLQWTYNSPSRGFQLREAAWNQLSLSYTHSFSRQLSLSGTFQYYGRYRHRLEAPLVEEFYSQQRRPEFKLKLLKTFGNP
ncbi:MAG TPA: outer membrane beta-barrel family protein [Allosphingosinicella sp.]